METIRLTMAQALLHFLDQQYVEVDGQEYKFVHGVMGIFGHGNVTGIGEALEDEELDLTYIQGHNEQGMVHAAAAFAKQKNRLGIYACTTSIGPGALNMVTAAATATVNRVPVLLLPGDNFACRQPDPVLQQLEVPSDYTVSANDAFRPVSRYFDRIVRPEQLMTAAVQAMRVLVDPADTGAVTLALPQDVQTEAYDYPVSFFQKRVHHIERRPIAAGALTRAVEAIRSAKRPLLIAGGGVHYSLATDALAGFAESFGIPVAETQAGKSALLWEHPWNVGAIGVTGSLAANRLAREADLVIAVGTRLADFTTASKTAFAADVPLISINVQAMDAVKMDAIPVLADAREALTAIAEQLQNSGYHSAHAEADIRAGRQAWNDEIDRLYGLTHDDGLVQTTVIGEINNTLAEDAVIVAAAGGLPGDLHRLWRVNAVRSYHMEYGFSCMGYEVAGAFGVKLADPARDVYALVGDGSYLMLHSELVTSLQEGQKITIILLDNSGYQCIHNLQRGHGSNGFGNELRYRDQSSGRLTGAYVPIDFAKHAESLGCKSYRVKTIAELQSALAAAKEDTQSVLIDIKVLPDTGTGNYESWWRVGVAEVSKNEKVQAAWTDAQTMIAKASKY
ncbi:3D-(3,5/4)-trihydroxycyclohexane-1,2-dione acylhydrolase (decyclizing) [Alicyclobacillus fodiniaquatilis]|uniref:3D-(3,5/4)-trihydroxycyclohexane-1,2-dione acylhydrolase (Decyclizing) n=1 Tax=Alicyclobacillus fodiniaquatilis TaxID=1661150 RepID=A0ABW4JIR1_9BACL